MKNVGLAVHMWFVLADRGSGGEGVCNGGFQNSSSSGRLPSTSLTCPSCLLQCAPVCPPFILACIFDSAVTQHALSEDSYLMLKLTPAFLQLLKESAAVNTSY